MAETKEQILLTALHLFAERGYDAVSVSMIAGELGMVKSALYKHYADKQDLFNSILRHMEQLDASYAARHLLPTGSREDAATLGLQFYGPMHLLYSLYDGCEDKTLPLRRLAAHIDGFFRTLKLQYPLEEA